MSDLSEALEELGVDFEEMWWCANHQSRWGYNPNCGWSPRGKPCPKVSKLLVDPQEGESE